MYPLGGDSAINTKKTLLLVGDASSDRAKLRDIFQTEYQLLEAEDAARAKLLLKENFHDIAAVLADVPLEQEETLRLLVAESKRSLEGEIPVIALVSSEDNGEGEERAFALGVADVRMKPYTPAGIRRRVQMVVELESRRQHLETVVDRYQCIIDQSEAIVFEWDLRTDAVTCSPKWEEQFGYPPLGERFSQQITQTNDFHPDDLPRMRDTVEAMRRGLRNVSMEVRIADSEGKYVWSRIRATPQTDEQGTAVRIVGMISNIDVIKRTTLDLQERAERDALTKLLNKDSTRRSITEYLAQRESSSLAAMMILDLDNFKAVNDSCGHLYGDTVLAKVGEHLRRLFRFGDVIGRIGGDEFLVLLRDIPNQEMVHTRCERILHTFREMFEAMMPDLNVSCSIGVALAPIHGTSYSELFQRSDEALYLAKSKGKNRYKVYDPQETLGILRGTGSNVAARIDSDERPGMANDSFVRYVFRCLYESEDIEYTIQALLSDIGAQLNVSRVYIFENNEDNTACSNTFEWCNQGIAPEKESLQNVSYITDIPGWTEVFDERGVFYCEDITGLDAKYRAILEPQGIKSMLQCAILDNGVFRGYVGFDECRLNRMWTREQIDLLDFLAEVMVLFLLKKRAQDKVLQQEEQMHRQNG